MPIFLPLPAHAYGGPGVAIGAIVVFLTVVFAFLASSFISIINFIKKANTIVRKKLGRKKDQNDKNSTIIKSDNI